MLTSVASNWRRQSRRELRLCAWPVTASPAPGALCFEEGCVRSISEPFTKVIGDRLPVFVRTVLLPFQGKIVFDGFLQSWQVDLGDEFVVC